MTEPLVDAEDFPRGDIDIYEVRTARHNIICECWGGGAGALRGKDPADPGVRGFGLVLRR